MNSDTTNWTSVYNRVDEVLRPLIDIVYPDEPKGSGLQAYLKDGNRRHPIVRYLADYSDLMGEDKAARIIGNQIGLSIPDGVEDDDIFLVNNLEYFLQKERDIHTVGMTLRDIMAMDGSRYREWAKGYPDSFPYYKRLYYVMDKFYHVKLT